MQSGKRTNSLAHADAGSFHRPQRVFCLQTPGRWNGKVSKSEPRAPAGLRDKPSFQRTGTEGSGPGGLPRERTPPPHPRHPTPSLLGLSLWTRAWGSPGLVLGRWPPAQTAPQRQLRDTPPLQQGQAESQPGGLHTGGWENRRNWEAFEQMVRRQQGLEAGRTATGSWGSLG